MYAVAMKPKKNPEHDLRVKKGLTPFFRRVETFVQNLVPKLFFQMTSFVSFYSVGIWKSVSILVFQLLTRFSFKTTIEFRNLKLTRPSLLVTPINQLRFLIITNINKKHEFPVSCEKYININAVS